MLEGRGRNNQKGARCIQGGTITQGDIFIVTNGNHVKIGHCISTSFKRDNKCCLNFLQVAKNVSVGRRK